MTNPHLHFPHPLKYNKKIKSMALNVTQISSAVLGGASAVSDTSSNSSAPAAWKPMASAGTGLRCRIAGGAPDVDLLSPPMSPTLGRSAVACSALVADAAAVTSGTDQGVMEHPAVKKEGEGKRGVPVFVMLPLDTVRSDGKGMSRRKAMGASLQALKSAGVEGVMVDVWWGLVERERPGEYNWAGYVELMEMARKIGLKVQAVMSFHRCGGNVGDSVTIPLPKWALEEMEKDPDLAYTDQWGRRNHEYISLGCDTLPVLKGRTPVQCYADFMRAFRDQFHSFLGSTIIEIQVGMGPAGELRYPSYPEQDGVWKFPGIGAFQCNDKYMISSLKAAAESVGKPKWGHGGPTDAGGYNNWPEDTPFFCRDGGWKSAYGEFFLSWYSEMLIGHGERILSGASSVFTDTGVKISVKVAGIHWHYGTRSHAPELTAGYYNTRFRDGYLPIARMLARHGAVFNFTCVEMRDGEQPGDAMCRPEGLVRQVAAAAREAGVGLAGENALPRYDGTAHDQIVGTALRREGGEKMCAFTYLRMGQDLFQPDNWRNFVGFVKKMGQGNEGDRCREEVEREAERFVHVTVPLVQEAAVTQSA